MRNVLAPSIRAASSTEVTGLRADVPSGVVSAEPVQPWAFGATTVGGLRAAGRPVDLTVSAEGNASVAW